MTQHRNENNLIMCIEFVLSGYGFHMRRMQFKCNLMQIIILIIIQLKQLQRELLIKDNATLICLYKLFELRNKN